MEAWQTLGRPALWVMAHTEPSAFVRVAAGLIPKEIEATVRQVKAEEISDHELANIATGGSAGASEEEIDPSQLN